MKLEDFPPMEDMPKSSKDPRYDGERGARLADTLMGAIRAEYKYEPLTVKQLTIGLNIFIGKLYDYFANRNPPSTKSWEHLSGTLIQTLVEHEMLMPPKKATKKS